MKTASWVIFLVIAILIFFMSTVYGIWYAFKHPRLTNTQLAIELWPVYIVEIVSGILAVMFNRKLLSSLKK